MLQGLNQKGSSAGDHDGSDKAASTGGKWHTDQRSGDATALDDGTHRFIANFCGGGDARLSFRWRDDLNEDSWVDVHYETGSMVGVDLDALTDELIEHKHTSCGRMSISFCYNVLVDDIITAATPEAIAAVAVQQVDIRLVRLSPFVQCQRAAAALPPLPPLAPLPRDLTPLRCHPLLLGASGQLLYFRLH